MDISAFLVSQQTDPQSRALAANALTPGMGGRGEEQQYDTPQGQQQDPLAPDGAIPMPATAGGLDQAALEQGSTPQDLTGDTQQFARGGRVGLRPFRQKQQQGGGDNGGLFSPSTRQRGQPDPSTNVPHGSIADIGMYDRSGNLKGITDIGITKNEIYGNPNFAHNDVANGEARGDNEYGVGGPAGDSSGGLAEGGSVNDLIDHADEQQGFEAGGPVREFGELSENIEDRRDGKELNMRLGTHTPEYQEKTGRARDLAAVSGLGRTGMEGDGRVMKFDGGGDVAEEQVGALPMPEDAPATPDANDAQQAIDARPAIIAARDHGYTKHGANAAVPAPDGAANLEAMLRAEGRGHPQQMETALKMFGDDPSKALTALHDFYSNKDPNPTPGVGRSEFEDMGAQASWAMLQHLRDRFDKANALARVADHNGNPDLAAQGVKKALNSLPDGTRVEVTPTPDGKFSVKDTLGRFGVELDQDGLHRIATTPFDRALHMGTGHLLKVTAEQAAGVKSAMDMQDQAQGLNPDGSPRAAPPAPRDPNVPGPNEPITIVRGGGMPHRNASAYSPTTTQRVNRETGQPIAEPSEHERIAAGQNQSRQDVARITAQGRLAAQGGANGMAKQNPDAEKRLTVEQYLRYLGPPLDKNGKPDPVAYEALRKRISDEYDAGRIKPGQQPGPLPGQGQQQGAAPPAAAPQPAQSGGNTPPPGKPGAKWTNPQGEQYEYTTNYQGQSGWKKVGRLPTG